MLSLKLDKARIKISQGKILHLLKMQMLPH